ncbi:hypothetical protein Glove_428g17 [Diversispora epigaea]|uniref:Uncharacterized protein n=1 Tax=Diversispora epigaea TaxID=1348612 RepID=A0A397GTI6_9GLOM|nr:hypothetical protein Glove_428g17 [Diversispora epigaea]
MDGKIIQSPLNGSLLKLYHERNTWKPRKKKRDIQSINSKTIYTMPPRAINAQTMLQFKQDLINIGAHTIKQIDCPYNLSDPWEESVSTVLQHLKTMQKKNRIMNLVYGYYLEKLIQLVVTPRSKWQEYIDFREVTNSYYYYLGATRIYQLFKHDLTQIYKMLHLTFNALSRMKVSNFQELTHYLQSIEEVVNTVSLS